MLLKVGANQVVFGWEVPIEGRFRHFRLSCQTVYADHVDALRIKQASGRL